MFVRMKFHFSRLRCVLKFYFFITIKYNLSVTSLELIAPWRQDAVVGSNKDFRAELTKPTLLLHRYMSLRTYLCFVVVVVVKNLLLQYFLYTLPLLDKPPGFWVIAVFINVFLYFPFCVFVG